MKPSSLSILFSEEASTKGDVYIIARSARSIDEGSPSILL